MEIMAMKIFIKLHLNSHYDVKLIRIFVFTDMICLFVLQTIEHMW